mmetsp:Transcript_79859/g.133397  ORF Transcript_79859/g.133397 Transcript_79859/m.133397 type:complete len:99 (-) Transcript_79859:58-354(-)
MTRAGGGMCYDLHKHITLQMNDSVEADLRVKPVPGGFFRQRTVSRGLISGRSAHALLSFRKWKVLQRDGGRTESESLIFLGQAVFSYLQQFGQICRYQ